MNSVFPFIAARDVKRLDDLVKKENKTSKLKKSAQ